MLSSLWQSKSDGYERMDTSHCSTSSNSSSPSSPILNGHYDLPGIRRSKSSSFPSQTLQYARRYRRKISLICIALVAFFTLETILGIIFYPPAYVVLEPDAYIQTLETTIQNKLTLPSSSAQQAIVANLEALRSPSTSFHKMPKWTPAQSVVPNTIFSSDQYPPSSEWAQMWKNMGFDPQFYNDADADAWVESEWKGTEIVKAWKEMPRTILRADMLRYLLLLLKGGTWSDMDTVPVMHLSNWTSDAIPFVHEYSDSLSPISSPAAAVRYSKESESDGGETVRHPIQGVFSIECTPRWSSIRGALEILRILPLNRHRNMQFVQWTIHLAPHHPIIIDVLRRILETMELYRAYQMEMDREGQRIGWGWGESREGPTGFSLLQGPPMASSLQAKTMMPKAGSAPWESIGQQWIYTQGHWRLGWHPTSVEEWTGPGVWTDSVVSYIYATTGIRPERLAEIREPTQVGDLVILPEFGFNPPRGSSSNPWKVSRVVHLFRGSWKHNVHKP